MSFVPYILVLICLGIPTALVAVALRECWQANKLLKELLKRK